METEMKIIQMHMAQDENNCHFEKTWIEVFKKTKANSDIRKELENAVDLYMKTKENQKFGFSQHLTPLHLAASVGQASLCEKLMDIVEDKKPRDTEGMTPLGHAAKNNHLDVLKVIGARVGYDWKSKKSQIILKNTIFIFYKL